MFFLSEKCPSVCLLACQRGFRRSLIYSLHLPRMSPSLLMMTPFWSLMDRAVLILLLRRRRRFARKRCRIASTANSIYVQHSFKTILWTFDRLIGSLLCLSTSPMQRRFGIGQFFFCIASFASWTLSGPQTTEVKMVATCCASQLRSLLAFSQCFSTFRMPNWLHWCYFFAVCHAESLLPTPVRLMKWKPLWTTAAPLLRLLCIPEAPGTRTKRYMQRSFLHPWVTKASRFIR